MIMNFSKLNPFYVYRGLPRPVYALFAATVINGTGIFVYPFLTLFLTQRLGYSVAEAGLFMFISSLLYVPGSIIGGKISDARGRKVVLIVSQSLASLLFLICGFLGDSPAVPFLIMGNLLFDGAADPARGAMQTDITNPENRQRSFALTYLGHNLGYSIGPVLGGFLFYRATDWLFFGNALMGFLSMVCIAVSVKETRPTREEMDESMASNRSDKAVEGSFFFALRGRSSLLVFGLLITVYGFAYGQTLFSLPLSAVEMFGERGPAVFGSLMSLNAITVILLNAPAVSISRRFRTLANVAFAGILYTIGFAGFVCARSFLAFYACTFIWTLGEIVDAVNTWYYIANNTPMSHRGRFNAVFPFVTGAGRAVAPYFGGLLIQRFSLAVLWTVSAASTAFAGALIGLRSRKEKN